MAGETVIINGHVISDVENVDKARAIGPDTVFLGGSSDDGQKLKEGTAGLVPVGRLDEHTLEEMQKNFYTKTETAKNFYSFSLSADNSTFRVDDKGTPMPSEQVAHIRLLKQGITDPVVWTKDGKTVEATDSLDVSVSDMAYTQAELKNIAIRAYDDWVTDKSYYGVIDEIPVLKSRKYYVSIQGRYKLTLNDEQIQAQEQPPIVEGKSGSSGPQRFASKISESEKKAGEQKLSVIYTSDYNENIVVRAFSYPSNNNNGAIDFKHLMFIDITELSLAYPQYSDEQLKTMLDEHLGYISAQQSVSIGGLMHLENFVPNPTSTDGWRAEKDVTNFTKANGIVTGTTRNYSSTFRNWILLTPNNLVDKNNYFCRINSITSTASYRIGLGWSGSLAINNNYGILTYSLPNTQYLSIGAGMELSTITFDTKDGVEIVDLSSSGLDLWLSLNGYDTDQKKAEWCNAHIPFFEGETNICVSVRNSLPIKVTAGAYEDTLTLQAVESLSTSLADSDILVSGDGFIRYKDGTQICWGKQQIASTGSSVTVGGILYCGLGNRINYTLPFVYGSTPQVTPTIQSENTAWITSFTANHMEVGVFYVGSLKKVNVGDRFNIGYIAIGRWK